MILSKAIAILISPSGDIAIYSTMSLRSSLSRLKCWVNLVAWAMPHTTISNSSFINFLDMVG
ncbi:MAG: hypothetical protein AAGE96_22385 [Cyanobacteria bacterium P01_G01_bin.19]